MEEGHSPLPFSLSVAKRKYNLLEDYENEIRTDRKDKRIKTQIMTHQAMI